MPDFPLSNSSKNGILTKPVDLVLPCSLFIASFALYVRTLAPSLLYGDAAEFQTIAYTLGLGHPTGYPIYVLLAKLFTFLPIGDIAYRVNLFSAFCAALTVGVVFLILRKLGARYSAGVYGSLALAFMPLFWKYATIAEVYMPSAVWLAMILLFVLQWKETHNPRWLFLAGLFGGSSLGIHTTVALSGVAVLLYLALSTRRWADWLHASLGAFIGIIIFLSSFFLLDSLDAPAGYYNAVVRPSLSAWDMTSADFDSPFERLAFLYFPPQFNRQFFSLSYADVQTRLTDLGRETSWSRWLALLGFIALFIPRNVSPARWREAMLLIVAFVIFIGFAATYDVFDYYVFYIPAIVTLVIFAGLGVDTILAVFDLTPRVPRFVPALLGIGILMIGFFPSAANISTAWKERVPPMLEDWESYYYKFPAERRLTTEHVVNSIEDNAIVFTGWGKVYEFYYVSHVLQGRTEMDFHEAYPQEGVTKFADSAIQYIEANIDVRPIYFSKRPPPQLEANYTIIRLRSGLFRIERK